jgi:histone deacetylase 1/2
MVTRAQDGIFRPHPRNANIANVAEPPPVPPSIRAALRDDQGRRAMQDEYNALLRNDTWCLVPRPQGARVISGKWILKNKLHPDGLLERRKARWVLRGDTQRPGVDFDQTFSSVVKPVTIRIVLTLAASNGWPVHQLDVSNAFLRGELKETVYCQQPTGFVDSHHLNHVWLLSKSLYGLR